MQFKLANPFNILPINQFSIHDSSQIIPAHQQSHVLSQLKDKSSDKRTDLAGKRAISQISTASESSQRIESDLKEKKKIRKEATEKKSTQKKIESSKNKVLKTKKNSAKNENIQLLEKNKQLEEKVAQLQNLNCYLNIQLNVMLSRNQSLEQSLEDLTWIRHVDFNWYMQMLRMHGKSNISAPHASGLFDE